MQDEKTEEKNETEVIESYCNNIAKFISAGFIYSLISSISLVISLIIIFG